MVSCGLYFGTKKNVTICPSVCFFLRSRVIRVLAEAGRFFSPACKAAGRNKRPRPLELPTVAASSFCQAKNWSLTTISNSLKALVFLSPNLQFSLHLASLVALMFYSFLPKLCETLQYYHKVHSVSLPLDCTFLY